MAKELAALAVSYGVSPYELSGLDEREYRELLAPLVFEHARYLHAKNVEDSKR